MKYFMHLRERPFNAIKKGPKKVEGRVPDRLKSRYHQMKSGDTIDFKNETTKEHLEVLIKFVNHYSDIRSMLEVEGVKNVLSSQPKTLEHGIESYNSFPGYKENVVKFGVFAIGIEPISK